MKQLVWLRAAFAGFEENLTRIHCSFTPVLVRLSVMSNYVEITNDSRSCQAEISLISTPRFTTLDHGRSYTRLLVPVLWRAFDCCLLALKRSLSPPLGAGGSFYAHLSARRRPQPSCSAFAVVQSPRRRLDDEGARGPDFSL